MGNSGKCVQENTIKNTSESQNNENNNFNNINAEKIKEPEIFQKNKDIDKLNEDLKEFKNKSTNILSLNDNNPEKYENSEIYRLTKILESKNNEIKEEKNKVEKLRKSIINLQSSNIDFEFNEGEELMSVIFQSTDDNSFRQSFLCKKNELFEELVKRVYIKLPELRNLQISFYGKGNMFDPKKTLEQNKIKDGELILFAINNI